MLIHSWCIVPFFSSKGCECLQVATGKRTKRQRCQSRMPCHCISPRGGCSGLFRFESRHCHQSIFTSPTAHHVHQNLTKQQPQMRGHHLVSQELPHLKGVWGSPITNMKSLRMWLNMDLHTPWNGYMYVYIYVIYMYLYIYIYMYLYTNMCNNLVR
jgi:hypothetical protein